MSWAEWNAEHRGANVRVAKTMTGSKVTSGGKHLGNIEVRGGRHVAVMQAGRGKLTTASFDTHEQALAHIRTAHGLSPTMKPVKGAGAKAPSGLKEVKGSASMTRIMSGSKHIGSVQKKSDGTHVAVMKAGNKLATTQHATHEEAVAHIARNTPGLTSAQRHAAGIKK